jgi:ABC-type enterochelin transport system permease subunit
MNDDSGTNILIEYMLLIVIMALFFSFFILMLYNMMTDSNRIIVGQELGVIANDMANRITEFSAKVNVYQHDDSYWESDISGYEEEVNVPGLVEGKTYTIDVTYDDVAQTGKVLVTYGPDYSINRTVTFRSVTRVVASRVSSTDSNPRMIYDSVPGHIRVVG